MFHEDIERSIATFPIIGIGASAGGLSAFESFFSGIPTDRAPAMTFVLMQHLAPDYKSILSGLVRRYTRMRVCDVEDGMVVEPNCTYIIPPNRKMTLLRGALHLLKPVEPRDQRMSIDLFFRSLAEDQHERAIGILLSGTGNDGTVGVRHIKSEGGMVMAQHLKSAKYDGMPRSAIATGLVDFELQPKDMATQLIAYISRAHDKPPQSLDNLSYKGDDALQKISLLLRNQVGHDFSRYKPRTILRRIERRMALHQITTMDDYIKFLQNTPAEVGGLFKDLMIGVTHFFRNPEAFKALEKQGIPKLFLNNQQNRIIRVWSPGCSSGEEAYSLAILLSEHQEAINQNFRIQVFATDIDSRAIATARCGLYPTSIEANVSPERLARFFQLEPSGAAYRIHQRIRDLLVFSEQNVIRDPPLPRIDLISCRNLLIYMNSSLQRKLVPLFNSSLKSRGLLFLGTSETVGGYNTLFESVNRKAKLYKKKSSF